MASRAEIAAAAETRSSRGESAAECGPANDLSIVGTQRTNRRSAVALWLGVVLGFLMLATAWFFLVRAAREADVKSVPLATQGGRP